LANVKGPTVALIEPGHAKVSFVSPCAIAGDGAAASVVASSSGKIPNREAIFINDDSSHAKCVDLHPPDRRHPLRKLYNAV
jgi:hypothetical protein